MPTLTLSPKPMERAKSLLDYIELTGLTLMEACKKAGISQPFGSKLISLHKLAPCLMSSIRSIHNGIYLVDTTLNVCRSLSGWMA